MSRGLGDVYKRQGLHATAYRPSNPPFLRTNKKSASAVAILPHAYPGRPYPSVCRHADGHVRNGRLSIYDRIFQGAAPLAESKAVVRKGGTVDFPSTRRPISPCPDRVFSFALSGSDDGDPPAGHSSGRACREPSEDEQGLRRTGTLRIEPPFRPPFLCDRKKTRTPAGPVVRPPRQEGKHTGRQTPRHPGTPSRRPHTPPHKTLHIKYLPCKNRRSPEGIPAHAGLSSCRSARLSFM